MRERQLIQSLQACEMFILELTLRAWNHSEENKRRTLQRNDIAAAITRTDIFDFLVRHRASSTLCTAAAGSAGCIAVPRDFSTCRPYVLPCHTMLHCGDMRTCL